jgi:hypothetical protein
MIKRAILKHQNEHVLDSGGQLEAPFPYLRVVSRVRTAVNSLTPSGLADKKRRTLASSVLQPPAEGFHAMRLVLMPPISLVR